jgi:hypothetical protein
MIGRDGAYLTCTRPIIEGRRTRVYANMSIADIDIGTYTDNIVLQWDVDTTTDPSDTKYMREHRLGSVVLRDVAHMGSEDFIRLIGSLGRRTNRVKGRKHVCGTIPIKSVIYSKVV